MQKSLRQIKDQIRNESFVGRAKEIEMLLSDLVNDPPLAKPIVNIVGVGGIGKSTLIRHFLNICKQKELPCSILDGRESNIKIGFTSGMPIFNLPEILKIWRMQLSSNKPSEEFTEFDAHIKKLTQINQKYLDTQKPQEKERISGLRDFVSSSAGGVIGTALAGIPGSIIGAAAGTMSGMLVEAIGKNVANLSKAGLTEADIEVCLNIESDLTIKFITGLNRIAEKRNKVVLLIDTFEMIKGLQEWIVNRFLINDINQNVRLIITGRIQLDSMIWQEWIDLIDIIELEPFSYEEMRSFMIRQGITSTEMLQRAQKITNGVPWALRLLIEDLDILEGDWEELLAQGKPYEISRKIVERYLNNVESEGERILIEACSVPLTFDADLISAILEEKFPGINLYKSILQSSFFGMIPSGRMFMIDPVKEFITDNLKVQSPKTLEKWNNCALLYYKNLLTYPMHSHDYSWEYLYHYYFWDLEARNLFLPKRDYLDSLIIETPKISDAQRILELDNLVLGFDPQISYALEDMTCFLSISSDTMRIAIDKQSGRVAGYAMVLVPRRQWCKSFESKEYNNIHPTKELIGIDQVSDFGDYLIDTIAVVNPADGVTGAVLIRSILPLLKNKPRKFFVQGVTEYGVTIAEKLRMKHIYTRHTEHGIPMRCYYYCLYEGNTASPLYDTLGMYKPKVSLEVACFDCGISTCPNFSRYSKT